MGATLMTMQVDGTEVSLYDARTMCLFLGLIGRWVTTSAIRSV
jgi:hypothetical protein